jgi:hypothetical protein
VRYFHPSLASGTQRYIDGSIDCKLDFAIDESSNEGLLNIVVRSMLIHDNSSIEKESSILPFQAS